MRSIPSNKYLAALFFLFILAQVFLIVVHPSPTYPLHDLDSSWAYATNYATAHGFAFGSQIKWTYGVLANVATHQYYPGLYPNQYIFGGLIALALTIGLMAVCAMRSYLLIAFPLMLAQSTIFDPIVQIAALLLVYVSVLVAPGRLRDLSFICLCFVLGMSPLIKGSYLGSALLSVVASTGYVSFQSRGLALEGIVAAICGFIVPWLWTGQHLGDVPAYLLSVSDLVAGYAGAMAIEGPFEQIIVYALIALTLCALSYLVAPKNKILVSLITAIVIVINFKGAFIRQDGHALIGGDFLLLLGFMLLLLQPRIWGAAAFAAGMVGWVWVYTIMGQHIDPALVASRSYDLLLAQARGPVENHRAAFEAAKAAIRSSSQLPLTSGRVEIMPFDIAPLLAADRPWAPRPVIQSYSAYNAPLERADAAYFAGASAPESLVFSATPIDGRYPALDDALSYPALLTHYQVAANDGQSLVLSKRDADRSVEMKSGEHGRAVHIGEDVPVPKGLVWSKLHLHATLAGRLLSAAFRPSILKITIRTADGKSNPYRLVADIADAGFLLSPNVPNIQSFEAVQLGLGERLPADRQVVSFRIDDADKVLGSTWANGYEVDFDQIDISPLVTDPILGKPQPAEVNADAVPGGSCSIDSLSEASGILALSGWAMISGPDGVENTGLRLLLTSAADRRSVSLPYTHTRRTDVASYFGHPQDANSGIEAQVALQGMTGKWSLSMEQETPDGTIACRNLKTVDLTTSTVR